VSAYLAEFIRLDLPATAKYLTILSACIAEMLARVDNLPQRDTIIYNIQLAAHEVCANIVDHAYAGEDDKRILINLTLKQHPMRFVIDLYDSGQSFDLGNTPTPNLEQPQVHGYGLFIIRSLMDEMIYQPQPGNNHWSLVKHL
jgi:serine/threonine-protein kinase RsbW